MKNETVSKCLICGKELRLTRGLCNTHYSEFNRARKDFENEEKRLAFEELCIKEKRVLPSMHSGRRKEGGFGDLVAKIQNQYANTEADAEAAEIEAKLTPKSPTNRKKAQ